MNMLELLNPAHERLICSDDDHEQLQGAGSAEVAAMSLMLLGQHEKENAQPAATTLCISKFNITAEPSGADETEGLQTPLPTAGMSTVQQTATSSSTATPSAPHLSPVADKLQQLVSWGAQEASTKRSPVPQQLEQSKRPRYARSPPRTSSKIEDLFSELRPARLSAAPSADAIIWDGGTPPDEAMDEYNEQLYSPCASSSAQYCAVTGCLRVAQHMEKCAVHKGMKLCCMSGCFRPVQSRGFCKSHGGGARCKQPGCKKGAISKGRCRTHGGGTRCAIPSCSKWAQRFGCCVRHSKAFAPSAAVPAAMGRV
ncbi:hypothetical protein Gpo141_00008088 [Globisporangium polare]